MHSEGMEMLPFDGTMVNSRGPNVSARYILCCQYYPPSNEINDFSGPGVHKHMMSKNPGVNREDAPLSDERNQHDAAHDKKVEQDFDCQHEVAFLTIIFPAHVCCR